MVKFDKNGQKYKDIVANGTLDDDLLLYLFEAAVDYVNDLYDENDPEMFVSTVQNFIDKVYMGDAYRKVVLDFFGIDKDLKPNQEFRQE